LITIENQFVVMGNFGLYKKRSFGIDLGNNNTLFNDEGNILASQPSYITFQAADRAVKAIGEKAYDMFEKTHDELRSVKPMKRGVIADFESAREMIKEMARTIYTKQSFFNTYDNIVSGVPYYTSEVERRALREALDQFNARNTYLLYEPLAAAVGMGLDIQAPDGKLVIDIGGGITEIVVISLSGIVAFQSIKVAGDSFDHEIQDYFRRRYNMSIGIKTSEDIKIKVGAVFENLREIPSPVKVKGKNLLNGLPITRMIDHLEMSEVLDKPINEIERAIRQTLETCPPELAADIYQNGLMITGGGAQLRGLKERLELKIKLPVTVDSNALTSVSRGLAKVLGDMNKYKGVLIS
jgi:rod shape-determining protein MreB